MPRVLRGDASGRRPASARRPTRRAARRCGPGSRRGVAGQVDGGRRPPAAAVAAYACGVEALELEQPAAEHRDDHRDQRRSPPAAGAARRRAATAPRAATPPRHRLERGRLRLPPVSSGCPGCRSAVLILLPARSARSVATLRVCAELVVAAVRGTPQLDDRRLRRAGLRLRGSGSGVDPDARRRTVAGVGVPSTLPSESRMNAGLLGGTMPISLARAATPLRVAEPLELHLAATAAARSSAAACCSSAVAVKDACCIEVLNSEQPGDAADQQQRHQHDERHPRRARRGGRGTTVQPGPLDGGLGDPRHPAAGLVDHALIWARLPARDSRSCRCSLVTRSTARSRTDAARGLASISAGVGLLATRG